METLILTVMLLTGAAGFVVGLMVAARHMDRDMEIAYLTGHVDGFAKAEQDRVVVL